MYNVPHIRVATLWSQYNCQYCDMAKKLLVSKGIGVIEKKIGDGYTREEFFTANPGARSVPQIWIDGELIGGFNEVKAMLSGKV